MGRGHGEAQARALRSNANKEAWMQVMNKNTSSQIWRKGLCIERSTAINDAYEASKLLHNDLRLCSRLHPR